MQLELSALAKIAKTKKLLNTGKYIT